MKIPKKHCFLEESSFCLGDCVRILLNDQTAIVLLVQEIYAVGTTTFPQVFITGPVLLRNFGGGYTLTQNIQTIPLSDFEFVQNLERAPACLYFQSQRHKGLSFKLPVNVNSAQQIEFLEPENTLSRAKQKEIGNYVFAPENVSEP